MEKLDVNASPVYSTEWGMSRWHVTPASHDALTTFGEAWLPPGDGHAMHNHPDSEEILYVLSGEGDQTIVNPDEVTYRIKAGDVVYVPKGVYHATFGAGWETLRLIVVHVPGPADAVDPTDPGFRQIAPGETQTWKRGPVLDGDNGGAA